MVMIKKFIVETRLFTEQVFFDGIEFHIFQRIHTPFKCFKWLRAWMFPQVADFPTSGEIRFGFMMGDSRQHGLCYYRVDRSFQITAVRSLSCPLLDEFIITNSIKWVPFIAESNSSNKSIVSLNRSQQFPMSDVPQSQLKVTRYVE